MIGYALNKGNTMKKTAILEVKKKLQQEQDKIRYQLRRNIGTMKSLVEEQTKLKRELAVYHELIKSFDA
jgi:hypothetical protein